MRRLTHLGLFLVVGLALPLTAHADGAGPSDCLGRAEGDPCTEYFEGTGTCRLANGELYCDTRRPDAAPAQDLARPQDAAAPADTGRPLDAAASQPVDAGDHEAPSSDSDGCSASGLGRRGAPELLALGLLLAACVAVERRARR
jgi:hypothetical protein